MNPSRLLIAGFVAIALTTGLVACGQEEPDEFESHLDSKQPGGADEGSGASHPVGTSTYVSRLEAGDCLVEDTDASSRIVTVVACDRPHVSEVFHLFDVSTPEFDVAAVEAEADERCTLEFEAFVGVPFNDSGLDLTWLTPTEESWERDDREVVCMVEDADGAELTGSLRDSRR